MKLSSKRRNALPPEVLNQLTKKVAGTAKPNSVAVALKQGCTTLDEIILHIWDNEQRLMTRLTARNHVYRFINQGRIERIKQGHYRWIGGTDD